MKIRDKFKKGKQTLSFEFFPPKVVEDNEKLFQVINELKVANPDFVSITYGAGGSTRDKTVNIASYVKNQLNVEVMAHLTCVNSTVQDIDNVIKDLLKNNIENILALRGDPPQGQTNFTKTIGGFGYASELVKHIRQNYDVSICVAGYPEGHIEAKSYEEDIKHLKEKVDNGADFIITQLFFDNNDFYKYRDDIRKLGVNIPLLPGILPILNYSSVKRITSLCGSKIPKKLEEKLEKFQDDKKAIEEIGLEYAINQIIDILKNDVDGIHLYAMNKSVEILYIYNNIKDKLVR